MQSVAQYRNLVKIIYYHYFSVTHEFLSAVASARGLECCAHAAAAAAVPPRRSARHSSMPRLILSGDRYIIMKLSSCRASQDDSQPLGWMYEPKAALVRQRRESVKNPGFFPIPLQHVLLHLLILFFPFFQSCSCSCFCSFSCSVSSSFSCSFLLFLLFIITYCKKKRCSCS
jgi:hypothetical protein